MSESAPTERDRNRAAMPLVSAFVDEIREYDPSARVLYACEGGLTLGAIPRARSAVPADWPFAPARA
jgi:hypothetical protein